MRPAETSLMTAGVHLYRLFIDDTGAGAARAVQAALSKVSTSEPLPQDSPAAGASDDGARAGAGERITSIRRRGRTCGAWPLAHQPNIIAVDHRAGGMSRTISFASQQHTVQLRPDGSCGRRQRSDGGQQRRQCGGGRPAGAAAAARARAL